MAQSPQLAGKSRITGLHFSWRWRGQLGIANTILETWDQTNIRTGCMNCHTIVQNNDFLWSLQMNAFTPTQVSFGLRPASPAVSELRALLHEQFK